MFCTTTKETCDYQTTTTSDDYYSPLLWFLSVELASQLEPAQTKTKPLPLSFLFPSQVVRLHSAPPLLLCILSSLRSVGGLSEEGLLGGAGNRRPRTA